MVVGTHKIGFLHGRVLGSRSVQITSTVPCSVAVIPEVDLRFRRGVVGGRGPGRDRRRDRVRRGRRGGRPRRRARRHPIDPQQSGRACRTARRRRCRRRPTRVPVAGDPIPDLRSPGRRGSARRRTRQGVARPRVRVRPIRRGPRSARSSTTSCSTSTRRARRPAEAAAMRSDRDSMSRTTRCSRSASRFRGLRAPSPVRCADRDAEPGPRRRRRAARTPARGSSIRGSTAAATERARRPTTIIDAPWAAAVSPSKAVPARRSPVTSTPPPRAAIWRTVEASVASCRAGIDSPPPAVISVSPTTGSFQL